jgi:hypothetical protein
MLNAAWRSRRRAAQPLLKETAFDRHKVGRTCLSCCEIGTDLSTVLADASIYQQAPGYMMAFDRRKMGAG